MALVTAMHATNAFDPASRVANVRQAAMMWSEITYSETLLRDIDTKHLPEICAAVNVH